MTSDNSPNQLTILGGQGDYQIQQEDTPIRKHSGISSFPKYCKFEGIYKFNLLTPNVNYSGRTVPLTSKFAFYIFIQQI